MLHSARCSPKHTRCDQAIPLSLRSAALFPFVPVAPVALPLSLADWIGEKDRPASAIGTYDRGVTLWYDARYTLTGELGRGEGEWRGR